MTPQISLVVPGIRPEMYQTVYDSFLMCWHGSFEIIFISPYELPEMNLNYRGEVQLIQDCGCPSRALQLGWIAAKAEWVSFATDDCKFDPDTMNKAWQTLCRNGFDYKTVVVCKYTESDNWSKWMLTDWYYTAWFHGDFRHPNIPLHFRLYMNGLISKQLMGATGGFDCKYETMAYCYNDWSMRAQFYGAKFIIEKDRLDHCSWQPKESSDHGPVHRAVMEHDTPLFRGVYWAKHFKPQCVISINNWQRSPSKWPRRYPQL
jgi:hypothetical protein